jgi:hypothetical protein
MSVHAASPHRLFHRTLPHTSSIIRNDFFRVVGPYDLKYRIAGDYEWFVRAILRHNARVFTFDRAVTIFNRNGVSSKPESARLLRGERRRIQTTYYHPGYGFRWAVNEAVRRIRLACRRTGPPRHTYLPASKMPSCQKQT